MGIPRPEFQRLIRKTGVERAPQRYGRKSEYLKLHDGVQRVSDGPSGTLLAEQRNVSVLQRTFSSGGDAGRLTRLLLAISCVSLIANIAFQQMRRISFS